MERLRKHAILPRFVLVLLLVTMAIAVFARRLDRADQLTVTANYSKGTLSLLLPYSAPRAGRGRLLVEILDPENRVLAGSSRDAEVAVGNGVLQQEVKPSHPLPLEDLVWERLRYRFNYDGEGGTAFEGMRAISQILRRPVVRVQAQKSYLVGAEAAIRVIVLDAQGLVIADGGSVSIELLVPNAAPRSLYSGRLNHRGTTQAQFRFPAGMIGDYQLHYVAETPIGSAEYSQPVQLQDSASILLTTEKPIYQPGQAIHARALALDRGNHQAVADRKLTFEAEDARGNKVFKRVTQTDKFGIASAEFALADEVNLGTYHLRALMGDAESPSNSAEVALNVERYVLPKFKVAIDFKSKDNQPQRDYRPGDHVTGTVRANYFFGKPAEGSQVTVKASSMDVVLAEAGGMSGTTDKQGDYPFDLTLPDYFAGRPVSQGAARVLVEATVKDTAGHSETRGEPITVSQSPLSITAVPESGKLIPNLENQVFLLTSYPDGTPAKTDISWESPGSGRQHTSTDDGGVAIVNIKTSIRIGAGEPWLRVEADDHRGAQASSTIPLASRDSMGDDQILLRTERAVYRAGERIDLKIFSTLRRGAAYVDIQKDGQTIATRDLDIDNGEAELSLMATPEMAGTLDCNAYIFGHDARPIGDHRLLFVQPADELKIETTADARAYKPGDEARVQFRVTNARGQGISAAIGVQVVDEAVFALAEKQPGFAKVFFYLEQEAMKPRFEIHSLSMNHVVEPVPQSQVEQRNRAARALFSATEMVNPNQVDAEFGRSLPQEKYEQYLSRYREAFAAQVDRLTTRLNREYPHQMHMRELPAIVAEMAKKDGLSLRDAWGKEIRVEPNGQAQAGSRYYLVDSAGADGLFDTLDDLAVYLQVRGKVASVASSPQTVVVVSENAEMEGVMGGVLGGIAPAPPRVDMVRNMIGRGINGRDFAKMTAAVAGASDQTQQAEAQVAASHVRSYFPEALYINPEIITDGNGIASISIPLADSITTWRMAMLASTQHGALGSGTSSLKVFQDFFIDLDLPVTLTQGDRVSIPVGVYNYSGALGDVSLTLQPEDWFSLDNDTADKSVAVGSGQVGSSQFTVVAKRIGKFKLTLSARMKGQANRADIVVREIEVVPDGREQSVVFNGRLESSAQQDVPFPANAIADASTILVRLYPGPLSQVIEGMDSILSMPGGCFEQTSSSTYPNVLALDYMKRTKKLTPEVHAKAEGYIANGYQRLLTFETPGGGFSWFGTAPANKILTAYGLMEFNDMSKVYDVDPRLIRRTQQWLADQQQPDGSWKPDASFINEGATDRYNSDVLRITAYLGWSLKNTGYGGPAVEKAKQFVESRLGAAKLDSYTLAVIANFAGDYGNDREFTRRAMQRLLDARIEKDDQVWWSADETAVYSTGVSAGIETTGLAVQALLTWGQASAISRKALRFIAANKDASGAWGTTQATIMALRALLLAADKGSSDVRGNVRVLLDGKTIETLALTAENNDLMHQFVFKGIDPRVAHPVRMEFDGTGGLAYQVVGRSFVPWDKKNANEALSIDVAYDRTQLAQNDIATAAATVKNNLGKTANMVMIDLGIPPGFDLLSEDLQSFQEKSATAKSGRLEKFSLTATQAILYFNALAPGETVTLRFRLRAKYPIRAHTFQSRVYEYYDPAVSATARPVQLEVRAR